MSRISAIGFGMLNAASSPIPGIASTSSVGFSRDPGLGVRSNWREFTRFSNDLQRLRISL